MEHITVQDLIDELLKLEDKSAIVVKYDPEYKMYNPIYDVYPAYIPKTLDVSDEGNKNIKQINSVIIY